MAERWEENSVRSEVISGKIIVFELEDEVVEVGVLLGLVCFFDF